MNEKPPIEVYTERRDYYKNIAKEMSELFNRVSALRLLAFVAAIFCLVLGLRDWHWHSLWIMLTSIFFIFFIILVWYHNRVGVNQSRYRELWHINDQALEKLARNWPQITERLCPLGVSALARDLDLFGHASLFQLISIAGSNYGQITLARWLVTPASPKQVNMRQEATKELAGQLQLLQNIHLLANFVGKSEGKPEPFLSWVEEEAWLTSKSPLLWLCRLLAAATCILFIAQIFAFVSTPLWMLLFIVNLMLTLSFRRKLNRTFARASSLGDCLESYRQSFLLLSKTDFSAPLLQNIQESLRRGNTQAHMQIQRLRQLVRLSDLRYSMLHFVVEGLTLWDIHIAFRLERWRALNHRAREWLNALGEIETIASLASLANAHPTWTFPAITTTKTIEAQQLGHPLLPPAKRVDNDIIIGAPGSFLLVTGSNMSGKSTLLRAIGVNVTLAQAGAPVCATSLILPPLSLASSMRVQDSLEQGISSYMAQLKSLAEVVAAAREPQDDKRILLYLLDEILQGTNSGERQIAVRTILKHLLAKNAIGAISTHDLELAKDKILANACTAVHFKETIETKLGKAVMRFDYKMRPGVATTTNALKLLELVGLAESEELG